MADAGKSSQNLEFCREFDGINAAFERLEKGDVKYRFVIDMSLA